MSSRILLMSSVISDLDWDSLDGLSNGNAILCSFEDNMWPLARLGTLPRQNPLLPCIKEQSNQRNYAVGILYAYFFIMTFRNSRKPSTYVLGSMISKSVPKLAKNRNPIWFCGTSIEAIKNSEL